MNRHTLNACMHIAQTYNAWGHRIVDNIMVRGAGGLKFVPRILRKVDSSFTRWAAAFLKLDV